MPQHHPSTTNTILEQVANIINPTTYHMSQKRSKNHYNIISTQKQEQQKQVHEQLQQDLLKSQLSTCLYGLKQFSQQLKKNNMFNQLLKHDVKQYKQQNKFNKGNSNQKPQALYSRKQYKLPTISQSKTNPNLLRTLSSKVNNNSSNSKMTKLQIRQQQQYRVSQQSHIQQQQYNSFILNHNNGQSLINLSQTTGVLLAGGLISSSDKFSKIQKSILSKTDGVSFLGTNDKSYLGKRIEDKKDKSQTSLSSLTTKNTLKKNVIHPKITKHLYQTGLNKALAKQYRYFSNTEPKIDQQEINKLGIYQSTNRFRKEFIPQSIVGLLSPKVQKKELGEQISVCKENQLFLTRPKELPQEEMEAFLKGEFAIISDVRDVIGAKDRNKVKTYQQSPTIFATKDINTINITLLQPSQNISPLKQSQAKHLDDNYIQEQHNISNSTDQQQLVNDESFKLNYSPRTNIQKIIKLGTITYLQTKNYEIIKDLAYLRFRKQHIQIWEQIQSLMKQVLKFLKTNTISSWKFKADNLLSYWSGKRLYTKDIGKILKINHKDLKMKKKSTFEQLISVVQAKKKTQAIVRERATHEGYMRWIVERIKGHMKIRQQTAYKINKAYELHQQLLKGDYQWDIQIYISSFSQNHFIRTTTHYMQSFQNMFTHMWRQSRKEMILILPTVNAQLLQVYQQKIKIKRAITIVCPQVHQLFPDKISLAGCLLFSYEALNKIKKLIKGRKAVIIPGRFSEQPKYELLISQFLRTPLLTSLKPNRDLLSQQTLFLQATLSVPSYTYIPPKSSTSTIIQRFATLISQHKQSTQWIFKINSEFSGRGLAIFSTRSSKVLRSILSSSKQTLKPLEQYLKRNIHLKLKINYQNSLFMMGDYLQRLSQKGGIIEQQKEHAQFYQVSFFIQDRMNSYIVSCYKCFSTNYANKAYIFQPVANVEISQYLVKLKSVLAQGEYLGYVSVNIMVVEGSVYGLQIKPFMTHLCCAQPIIKAIQARRQLKLNIGFVENQLHTSTLIDQNDNQSEVQTQRIDVNHPSQQVEHSYLFIPNIVLADVPLDRKASFIQSLVLDTWTRNKFNILDINQSIYLSNGLSLSVLIAGKDLNKMKKVGIETIRMLSQKSSTLKIYYGKNQPRDVFQFGDIIKALTQIK